MLKQCLKETKPTGAKDGLPNIAAPSCQLISELIYKIIYIYIYICIYI